jgi:hypothetical protein
MDKLPDHVGGAITALLVLMITVTTAAIVAA